MKKNLITTAMLLSLSAFAFADEQNKNRIRPRYRFILLMPRRLTKIKLPHLLPFSLKKSLPSVTRLM